MLCNLSCPRARAAPGLLAVLAMACATSGEAEPEGALHAQQAGGARTGAWVARTAAPDTRASEPQATAGAGLARSGSWSASVELSGSPSWKKLIHYDTKVGKNTRYVGHIWARGRGKVRLDVVNAAWKANVASVYVDATSTWTRYALPEFSSGDNDVLHFNVYDALGGAAGTVYFDDAFLGRPGGPNLLANGSFDEGTHSWITEGKFRIAARARTPVKPPVDEPDEPDVGPDPDGAYFAEVTASGPGCPPGTWSTRISRDGLVFTTSFSAYVAQIDPGATLSVRDCQLVVRLHTPAGRSFSVQTFSYGGYAYLARGVVGRQLATYSFEGLDQQGGAARTELSGPYDDDFLFRDEVKLESAVWSPCGIERVLNVNTRLLVQSSAPGLTGYMNLTAADGAARLEMKLSARSCSGVR